MHEHGQRAPVELLPDRREQGIGPGGAADVGERHHAERAMLHRAVELGERLLGELQRQRGNPADALWVGALRLGKAVVHRSRGARAHLGVAPVDVRPGEREHRHADARLVHRGETALVVEHARRRRHERHAVGMDHLRAADDAPEWRSACRSALEEGQPFLAQHVRVDVDRGLHARPALLLRDLLVADHLGPARDLRAEQVLRLARRAREGLGRLHAQPLDHVGPLERDVHRLVQRATMARAAPWGAASAYQA